MIEVRLADGRVVQIDTDDPAVAAAAARRFMGVAATPAAPVSTPAPALLDTGGPGVTLGPTRNDLITLRSRSVMDQINQEQFSLQQRAILLKGAVDAANEVPSNAEDVTFGQRYRANFSGLGTGADNQLALTEAGMIARAGNTGRTELAEEKAFLAESDNIVNFLRDNPDLDPAERAELEALAVDYRKRSIASGDIGGLRSYSNAMVNTKRDARFAALPGFEDGGGHTAAILGGLTAAVTSPTTFIGGAGASAVKLIPRIFQAAIRSGGINAVINALQGSVAQAERIVDDRGQEKFSFVTLGLDAGLGAAFGGALGGGGTAVAGVARKLAAAVGRRLNKPPGKVTAADIDSTVQLEFDNLVRDPEVAAFFEANNITRDNMRNIDPSMAAGRLDERRAEEVGERVEVSREDGTLPRSASEDARAQRLRAQGRAAPRAQPDDRGTLVGNQEGPRGRQPDIDEARALDDLGDAGNLLDRIDNVSERTADGEVSPAQAALRERTQTRVDESNAARGVVEGGQVTTEGRTLVQPRDSGDPGSEAGRQLAEVTDADRAAIEAEFGVVPRGLEQQAKLRDVIRQREDGQGRVDEGEERAAVEDIQNRGEEIERGSRSDPRVQSDAAVSASNAERGVIEAGRSTEGGDQTAVAGRTSADAGAEAGRASSEVTTADRQDILDNYGFVPESLEQQARMRDILSGQHQRQVAADDGAPLRSSDETGVTGEGRPVDPASRPNAPADNLTSGRAFEDQDAPVQRTDAELARETSASQVRSANKAEATGKEVGTRLETARNTLDEINNDPTFADLSRRKAAGARMTNPELRSLSDLKQSQARARKSVRDLEQQAAELSRRAGLGSRSESGTSDRPHRGDDLVELRSQRDALKAEVDSARSAKGITDDAPRGTDLERRLADAEARVKQASDFEATARGRADEAQAKSEEDLIREWEARQTEQDRVREQAEQEGRTHERPDAAARDRYEDSSSKTFSNNVADPDPKTGQYATDEFGFVLSKNGGPARWGATIKVAKEDVDKLIAKGLSREEAVRTATRAAERKINVQLAKWIMNKGQKTGDSFEIANHPSGKGFAIKRTIDGGGAKAEASAKADANAKARADAPQAKPGDAPRTGEQRQIPAPERQSQGDTSPRAPDRGEAPAGTSPRSPEADAPTARADDTTTRTPDEDAPAKAPDEDAPTRTPDDDDGLGIPEHLRRGAQKAADDAEPTPGSPKLDTTDGDAVSKRRSDLGKKLYASPLDPALFREVFDTLADIMGWTRQKLTPWMDGMTRAARGMTSTSLDAGSAFMDSTVRLMAYANDSMLAVLQNRYTSKAIGKFRSMFFAEPGVRRDVAEQDFHAAINQRYQMTMNAVGKIYDEYIGTGFAVSSSARKQRRSDMEQLGKILRTPHITGTGKLQTAARAIRKLLNDEHDYQVAAGVEVGFIRGYLPRELDITKVMADPDKFRTGAEKLYRNLGATAEQAREMATNWMTRIAAGDMGFARDGSAFVKTQSTNIGTRFEKHRRFGPEADVVLKDFYIQNIADILPRYFMQSARRTEWVRRMGPNLEKFNELLEQMRKEGVPESAIEEVVSIIQSSAGMMRSPAGKARSVASVGRVWTVLGFLSHATATSLVEPTMNAIRTGRPMDALVGYRDTLAHWIPLLKNIKYVREMAEFAEDMGYVSRVASDDMLLQERFGGDIQGSKARSISSNFFQLVGLTQLTESTRKASVGIGSRFIYRMAFDVHNKRWRQKSARMLLREMGIPDDKIDGFSKWMNDNQDNVFDAARQQDEMGEFYRVALGRFLDGTTMRPNSSLRPKFAQHPFGQLVYALQSYLYAFHKNVINRVARNAFIATTGKGMNIGDRMRLIAPIAMIPIPVITSFYIGELRDAFNNIGKDEADKYEMTPAMKAMRAVSRSGFVGIPDTALNFIFGARFQKDPATVALGPLLGSISMVFSKFVGLFSDKNSPNTNTAERGLSKAIYNIIIQPALSAVIASIPRGLGKLATIPAFIAEAGTMQVVNHPGARDAFADVTAGPKRTTGGSNRRGPPRRNRPNRPARQRMRN